MKELDIRTSSEWIQSLITAQIPPSEVLPYLSKIANEKLPHTDWQTLGDLETTSDTDNFLTWLDALIRFSPPKSNVLSLWFGLFNPVLEDNEGHYVTLQIYVAGGYSRDLDETGADAYWVEGRYFNSSVLDHIYGIAYGSENQPLGNSAEYLLGLGYACSLVMYAAKQLGAVLLTGGISERVIVTGFDSGDFITLGNVDSDGFHAIRHLS